MSRSAAAALDGSSRVHQAGQSVRAFSVCATLPRVSAHVSPHRIHFHLTNHATCVAACIAAIFVSCLVLEAFDKDIALWPFGTEDFAAPAQDHFEGAVPDAGALSAARAAYGFIVTAGAQLVLRYRARSALVTDDFSLHDAFHRAEPWGVTVTGAPALGPYISGPESTADA